GYPRAWSASGRSLVRGGFGAFRLAGLDQLDLVAVRILDEGDHGTAVLHRPGRARDLHTLLLQTLTGAIDIRHADRKMAETGAVGIVFLLAPIVSQLQDRMVCFVTIADEGQGEFASRIVLPPKNLHS